MSEQGGRGVPDESGLTALEDTYDVIGELRGADDLLCYLARRRTSKVEVMITVVPVAIASENNALALFAADVHLLSGVSHPGVLQAIEGRWLGNGSFAAVTERPRGPTIGEMLAAGDHLGNPQVASILREVRVCLDWARGLGVIHRGVNVDAMYLQPGTGGLEIALLPVPIAASGVPGEAADARTLGDLAWTLLAGHDPEADPRGDSLSTVRPDLAEQVVAAVEAMRSATRENLPDPDAFAARIASADVLRQAEEELAAQRAQLAEAQRRRRSGWDSESAKWRRRALEAESQLKATRINAGPRHMQAIVPAAVIAIVIAAMVMYGMEHRRGAQKAAPVPAAMTASQRPTASSPAIPPVVPAQADDVSVKTAAGTVAPPADSAAKKPAGAGATPTDSLANRGSPLGARPIRLENAQQAHTVESARAARARERRRLTMDSAARDSSRRTDSTSDSVSQRRPAVINPCSSASRDTSAQPDTTPVVDSMRARIRRPAMAKCDSIAAPPP